MKILLSQATYERDWPRVAAVAPGATAVRLGADGQWSGGDPTEATIGWFTEDIGAANVARRFFGALVRAQGLEWFQSAAAGHDDPIYERLRTNGARVTTAHVNAIPIAEHVIRCVIDHRHGAARWRAAAVDHRWETGLHDEVHGTTLTIVGLGSIGSAVASLGRALGMELRGVRQHPNADDTVDLVVGPDRLHETLDGADTVVLCTPLTAATRGIAGHEFFAAMAHGSLFVNVGRGGLVDDAALITGLDRGRPAAAALDVVTTEPLPPEHPFWADERIVITPHVAGSSTGNQDRLTELFSANLAAFVDGRPLQHEIP